MISKHLYSVGTAKVLLLRTKNLKSSILNAIAVHTHTDTAIKIGREGYKKSNNNSFVLYILNMESAHFNKLVACNGETQVVTNGARTIFHQSV